MEISMLLMIDNYDSFTYNLVQYFQRLDQEVLVKRNDAISLAEIKALNPEHIVISPGPCSPNEAGISLSVIEQFKGVIPILGICLGHQAIAQALGAKVIRAHTVMHGKTSQIKHTAKGVFEGLPDPLTVCRYHSLVVDKQTLPECLEVTAWTQTSASNVDEIMGMCHTDLALEGVQFHPEAILTQHGLNLLDNFIRRF
ncbi:glutamine amidotransferase [Pseudoalteromonas sp. A25]|nr:glutamine amidotransferase [Pseudoalteromonas sp. A25]